VFDNKEILNALKLKISFFGLSHEDRPSSNVNCLLAGDEK